MVWDLNTVMSDVPGVFPSATSKQNPQQIGRVSVGVVCNGLWESGVNVPLPAVTGVNLVELTAKEDWRRNATETKNHRRIKLVPSFRAQLGTPEIGASAQ